MGEYDTQYDEIYSVLFDAFKHDKTLYEQEAKRLRTKIAATKPSAPIGYTPYPRITDAKFTEKLLAKKEFQRFQIPGVETSTDHITYDDISTGKAILTSE